MVSSNAHWSGCIETVYWIFISTIEMHDFGGVVWKGAAVHLDLSAGEFCRAPLEDSLIN